MSYQTKRAIAVTALREAIINGELVPGARVVLDELVQRYDLSLTPIREAMPVLEAEGFIVQVPHRGAIVSPMDRDEIMELYATRSAMEALVTRHAVPNLTDDDLARMSELHRRMDSFHGNWESFLAVDKEFHSVLYEAAGSQRWVQTVETLWRRSTRYMLKSTAMNGATSASQEDHGRLLAACQARDVEQATEAIVAHLAHAEQRLLSDWTAVSAV